MLLSALLSVQWCCAAADPLSAGKPGDCLLAVPLLAGHWEAAALFTVLLMHVNLNLCCVSDLGLPGSLQLWTARTSLAADLPKELACRKWSAPAGLQYCKLSKHELQCGFNQCSLDTQVFKFLQEVCNETGLFSFHLTRKQQGEKKPLGLCSGWHDWMVTKGLSIVANQWVQPLASTAFLSRQWMGCPAALGSSRFDWGSAGGRGWEMMLFPVNLPSFPITLPTEQTSYAAIFPWLLQVVCKGLFLLMLCCYQMCIRIYLCQFPTDQGSGLEAAACCSVNDL